MSKKSIELVKAREAVSLMRLYATCFEKLTDHQLNLKLNKAAQKKLIRTAKLDGGKIYFYEKESVIDFAKKYTCNEKEETQAELPFPVATKPTKEAFFTISVNNSHFYK